jgi:hypothetical protein
MSKIAIINGDVEIGELEARLKDKGYTVDFLDENINLSNQNFDLYLVQIELWSQNASLMLNLPRRQWIGYTNQPTIQSARSALLAGAQDYASTENGTNLLYTYIMDYFWGPI